MLFKNINLLKGFDLKLDLSGFIDIFEKYKGINIEFNLVILIELLMFGEVLT